MAGDDLICDDSEQLDDFEYEFFLQDLQMLAKHYISLFFQDKSLYCGGPVPQNMLHSSGVIKQVINTDICDGVDLIYKALGVQYTEQQLYKIERSGNLPDDVKHVISLLNQCSRLGIPKCFASGIVLIYLDFCEGKKLAA
jgi:hypothetical protein